jgi:hypothetical protein
VAERGRAGRGAAVVVSCCLVLTSCADYTHLSYRVDKRIRMVEPESHALVTVPLRFGWVEQTDTGAASYALFVDRAPVKPGRSLSDVARGDSTCQQTPGCPDVQYLNDRGVFVTRSTSIELDHVPPLHDSQSVQLHDAVLVLIGPDGRRMGESAWHVQFRMRKRVFR